MWTWNLSFSTVCASFFFLINEWFYLTLDKALSSSTFCVQEKNDKKCLINFQFKTVHIPLPRLKFNTYSDEQQKSVINLSWKDAIIPVLERFLKCITICASWHGKLNLRQRVKLFSNRPPSSTLVDFNANDGESTNKFTSTQINVKVSSI